MFTDRFPEWACRLPEEPPTEDEEDDSCGAGDGKWSGVIRRCDQWAADERAEQKRDRPDDQADAARARRQVPSVSSSARSQRAAAPPTTARR